VVFADLDFHVAGRTITVDLIDPKSNQPCPLTLAPDGWITGLPHLTAVAGAPKGSLVAIDDFGNDLHPYAIRELTQAFRDWAEERDLTVCLASHSPVLLDEFKEDPGAVFVMEHGLEKRPVPLTELYETDWLARFSLGRLYEHGEFGGQRQRLNRAANGANWTSGGLSLAVVALIPTGKLENAALGAALATLFPDDTFVVRLEEMPLSGFTSRDVASLATAKPGPVPISLDELAAELVNAILPGRRELRIDFACIVEDLELCNQGQPDLELRLFRHAVCTYISRNWP
jgi:hypothetical protein